MPTEEVKNKIKKISYYAGVFGAVCLVMFISYVAGYRVSYDITSEDTATAFSDGYNTGKYNSESLATYLAEQTLPTVCGNCNEAKVIHYDNETFYIVTIDYKNFSIQGRNPTNIPLHLISSVIK